MPQTQRYIFACALLLTTLSSAFLLGCQPSEHAVLIEVRSQRDVDELFVTVISLDEFRPGQTSTVRRFSQSAEDIDGDPIRVAIHVGGPSSVLVHIQGTDLAGNTLVATRCYEVDGVVHDGVLMVPLSPETDVDGDGFSTVPASLCFERTEDGGERPCVESDHLCLGPTALDCNDEESSVHPGAAFVCQNGVDEDCDGSDEPCADLDGDGVQACSPTDTPGTCDCDDSVVAINPRAQDACPEGDLGCATCNDGIDQDCDGEDAPCDRDGDGFTADLANMPDCDDNNAAINPGAMEVCDGIDNNCNALADELEECRGPDLDGDGVAAEGRGEEGAAIDCNDCDPAIHEGAVEICGNQVDEDCDNVLDNGCPETDADGDGIAPPRDCNDSDPLAYPRAAGEPLIDRCDDGIAQSCLPGGDRSCADDTDGDGFVEPPACEGNAAINPDATEACDGIDNDCDGIRDEVLLASMTVGGTQYPQGVRGCTQEGGAATVEFETNFGHCGGCRVFCDPDRANVCANGQCDCSHETDFDGPCSAGDSPACCGDSAGCVDLDNDPGNCGACGVQCGSGESCSMGRCTCGTSIGAELSDQACPEPDGLVGLEANICCGESCTDARSDDTNCGGCGNDCGENSACSDRICACDSGWGDCFGGPGCETDLNTTVEHCNECDRPCSSNHGTPTCAGGACTIACDRGYDDCNGNARRNGCEAALTTLENCGGCGIVCSINNADETCLSGSCRVDSCRGNFADCDSNTSDCETPLHTLSDCTFCGDTCSAPHATTSCDTGNCLTTDCDIGWANCSAAPGCETDLNTDQNCGRCGNNCGANATCQSGVCECDAGTLQCGPVSAGYCETSFSVNDCGGCGITCGPGETCNASGQCVCGSTRIGGGPACTGAADACCSGSCIDFDTNASNCGGCGAACLVSGGTAVCSGRTCSVSCNSGRANCDVDPLDCEINTLTDASHCNGCNNACPATGGTAVCSTGSCGIMCDADRMNCDGNSSTCDANIQTDPAHCNGCNMPCPATDGAATCTGGSCGITCNPGRGDCDMNGSSCETNTQTDASHCSGCGLPCTSANGTATCASGTCDVSCNSGRDNCNGDPSDCETNTDTDVNRCGDCTTTCTATNATPFCSGGSCDATCDSGRESCGGDPTNCETNVATATSDCGGCGITCGGGETCSAGACSCGADSGTLGSGAACGGGESCCGGGCANTATDINNCGGCGVTCGPSETCSGGQCTCNGDTGGVGTGAACGGTTCCPAMGCVDMSTDLNNCGACAATCGADETCGGGLCTCGDTDGGVGAGPVCTGGQVCCTTNDPDSCVGAGSC